MVDGNDDSRLGDTVLSQAGEIVWLDLPLPVKFVRLWNRTLRRIRHKVTLWNENRETWRGAFLGRDALLPFMIRVHFRHRREWPALFGSDPLLVRLRSSSEVERWLSNQIKP